jgi:hypothetical protein
MPKSPDFTFGLFYFKITIISLYPQNSFMDSSSAGDPPEQPQKKSTQFLNILLSFNYGK